MGDSDLSGVVVGWILGVLSTPLVMYFNAFVERRRFQDVLKEELREVRFRLVISIYLLKKHLGKIDRKFLDWVATETTLFPEGVERNQLLEIISHFFQPNSNQLAYCLHVNKKNSSIYCIM